VSRPRWHPSAWGLGTRFVVLFLVLLLAIQAAGFGVIRARFIANARASVAGELQVGERALDKLLAQRATRLADAARVLAADFGFRDAVSSGDRETQRSALFNHGSRIKASATALLDNDYAVQASTAADDAALAATAARVGALWRGAAGGAGEVPVVVDLVDGQPTQFVLAPLRTPLPVGWVLMGFALDDQLVRDLDDITALDLTLLVRTETGWRSAASRLPPALDAALRARADTARGTPTVEIAGVEYGWRARPLGTGVQALLLHSVDAAVAPYLALQWPLAAITLAGVLAFALGGALTARRITTPVRRLVDAAERLGRGEMGTPLDGTARLDEIGQLAQAFESMRRSIAAQQAELERLAYWDALTGLPNRAGFSAALRTAIAAAGPASGRVAVVMLDLDRFKAVNKATGYAFGDRLLQAVAQRLGAFVALPGDQLARLSGDEFALLLPGRGTDDALEVARRITTALEAPVTLDEQAVDLPAGIGVAVWPEHAADAQTLLARAEAAMVDAKQRSLGPLPYDAAADSASAVNLSLLSELRRAVAQGQLRLYLQPKVALSDGRLVGAEALVRWQHPQRGMIPPMQFIPFAEQTGAVRALTLWMFGEAARRWRELRDERGAPLCVSVNLSTHDLLDQELPDKLGAILVQHAAPATGFCLEITESAIMDDPQRAEATLQRLAERGFKLSIDDFGTGYSSLGYLKRLPVDELKIDKSFVLGMVDDSDDAKLVRLVVDLAHNLGLTVVAEGVENAPIWNALHRLGCDEAQGYHMSRPLPADTFIAWSRRWNDRVATGWGGLEVA
jgi:diguanylate cyclase (GGDEF)-like protein